MVKNSGKEKKVRAVEEGKGNYNQRKGHDLPSIPKHQFPSKAVAIFGPELLTVNPNNFPTQSQQTVRAENENSQLQSSFNVKVTGDKCADSVQTKNGGERLLSIVVADATGQENEANDNSKDAAAQSSSKWERAIEASKNSNGIQLQQIQKANNNNSAWKMNRIGEEKNYKIKRFSKAFKKPNKFKPKNSLLIAKEIFLFITFLFKLKCDLPLFCRQSVEVINAIFVYKKDLQLALTFNPLKFLVQTSTATVNSNKITNFLPLLSRRAYAILELVGTETKNVIVSYIINKTKF